MTGTVDCLVLVFALSATATPRLAEPAPAAEPEPTQGIEADVFVGWGLTAAGARPVNDAARARNHAPALAVSFVYRSPYFLAPFLDVGWAPLFSSDDPVEVRGQRQIAENRMQMFWAAAGPSLSWWRLRLAGGLGAFVLQVSSVLGGQRITPVEIDLGYTVYLSGDLWRWSWLTAAAELRGIYVAEGDLLHLSLGVSLRILPLRW